ncbi:hypothetical protein H6G06_14985 [Anabaena sphaerica FACHB-251]|uniref:Uncharacterized protein n=1 Tax=Anabaena sphaerica FACHB-251 TaxID=2692883 RepID=A0A926WHN9_9NOST|nr:hypothetical protein [Anabaena sphaerica]MBD2294751.1 hypothetical protein [Anabaena sphaerica FACHB-251]
MDIFDSSKFNQISESKLENDDSLEKLIKLVDEWMADQSGYDKETYPQLEVALTQNNLAKYGKIISHLKSNFP